MKAEEHEEYKKGVRVCGGNLKSCSNLWYKDFDYYYAVHVIYLSDAGL